MIQGEPGEELVHEVKGRVGCPSESGETETRSSDSRSSPRARRTGHHGVGP